MSQFIENLKRATQAQTETLQRQAALRLHNADVLRAKAPIFWDATKTILRTECGEMQRNFPNDPRYNPFVNEQMGFTLNGKKMPRKILMVDLNLDGQCLTVSEATKYSLIEQPIFDYIAPISIAVGSEEELVFTFRGRPLDTPESLAEAMISYVCG
jgi:hypothetical protein